MLFELLYPVIYHLLILMIENFQWIRFGDIIANGQSVEIVFWLINVYLQSYQRDDLGWNSLVARVVDDESLVPEDVPSLLHKVRKLAHFEQVALFDDP